MPGIDYSKWDKICDSDDSEDSSLNRSGQPKVTHLEYPSRVTISSNGVHIVNPPPRATASPFMGTGGAGDKSESSNASPPASGLVGGAIDGRSLVNTSDRSDRGNYSAPDGGDRSQQRDEESEEESEDHMMYGNLTYGGGREGESHLWSQTQDTASVSFILPSMQTKAKDIHGFCLQTEEQSNHTSICVISFGIKGEEKKRQYTLRYPVKVDEDVVEGCWSLHSLPTYALRLLVVQLVKEPIAVGMTLWWDRCFATDTTIIDTTKISGRKGADASRAEAFRESWERAHEEFKRRVKEQQGKRCIVEDESDADDGT